MAWVVGFKLPTRCGSFCQIFDQQQFCWFERDLTFGDQVESLNVTFSTDRDLNHLVDVLLGEQWMKHTSVSVNLES